ncbi:hypothetical protein BST61_g8009 [Cercospora zeina]
MHHRPIEDAVPPRLDSSGSATTITDLPPELRVQIYEYILQDPRVSVTCFKGGKIETKSPWALLLVCRLLRSEIKQMMPKIPNIAFEFSDANCMSICRWCNRMGREGILQMKKWTISGTGVCLTGWDEDTKREAGVHPCFRSITVDLMKGYEDPSDTSCKDTISFDVDTRRPICWSSLVAVTGDSFCDRGCVGCEYCTRVAAIDQVAKMKWSGERQPLPNAELLVNLGMVTAKDLSGCLCGKGCGIEGCDHHKDGQDARHVWRQLNLQDFRERYSSEVAFG